MTNAMHISFDMDAAALFHTVDAKTDTIPLSHQKKGATLPCVYIFIVDELNAITKH